jgi:hypothetical protein
MLAAHLLDVVPVANGTWKVAESFKVSNIERLYFIGLWKGRIR